MAKLCAHGAEIHRFLSTSRGALMSVCADGVTLYRRPGGTWKVYSRKKAGVSMEAWRKAVDERYAKMAVWKRDVKSLPSIQQLDRWSMGDVCKTVTGYTVEPDGVGPDGAPSWLLALGMV